MWAYSFLSFVMEYLLFQARNFFCTNNTHTNTNRKFFGERKSEWKKVNAKNLFFPNEIKKPFFPLFWFFPFEAEFHLKCIHTITKRHTLLYRQFAFASLIFPRVCLLFIQPTTKYPHKKCYLEENYFFCTFSGPLMIFFFSLRLSLLLLWFLDTSFFF